MLIFDETFQRLVFCFRHEADRVAGGGTVGAAMGVGGRVRADGDFLAMVVLKVKKLECQLVVLYLQAVQVGLRIPAARPALAVKRGGLQFVTFFQTIKVSVVAVVAVGGHTPVVALMIRVAFNAQHVVVPVHIAIFCRLKDRFFFNFIVILPYQTQQHMKRLFHCFAALMFFAMVSCSINIRQYEDRELWISYDPINVYTAPDESAEVARQYSDLTRPLTIEGKDETGKWGRYVVYGNFFNNETFWIPLEKMIYVGREDLDEVMETYVVRTKETHLYRHPKADQKDVIEPSLYEGDTVQVTAQANGWVHVRKFQYDRTSYSSNRYGWVALKDLQDIGLLAANDVDESAHGKAQKIKEEKQEAKRVERAKRRGVDVESEDYQRLKQSRSFYQMVYRIIGIYALVVWLFFKRGASYRGKAGDVKLILFLAPLLFVCSYFSQGPSWFFALLLPVMVYVLLYPFLYIRNAGFYKFLYPVVCLVAGGFYLYQFSKEGPEKWVLILLGIAVVVISLIIIVRVADDICPRCGYYAGHYSGTPQQVGQSRVRVEHNPYKEYTHTTTEQVGRKTVITEHYVSGVNTTTTTETDYKIDRRCMKCGHVFLNHKTVRERV